MSYLLKNILALACLSQSLLASIPEGNITRTISGGENWKIISRGSFGTGTVGYTITSPGNYMLSESFSAVAGNSTAIIQINTDDVVLDLGGHTINGLGAAGKGILINGKKNISVQNGYLNSVQGINVHVAANSKNIQIDTLSLTNPGTSIDIQLDASNVKMSNITIIGNGSVGNCIVTANALGDLTFENIRISTINGKGIMLGNNCYNVRMKNIQIDTCSGSNNAIALGTSCYDILLDTFRCSNISSDGITLGSSSYGVIIKNGFLTNCTGNGILLNSDTHGIHLSGITITGCANGMQSLGTNGSIIENCTVSKSNGTGAYACKLTNCQNILISKSNFFESISAGNPVTGLWLTTCSNINCTAVQSSGHTGAQAFGFKLETNCSGCTFEKCIARSNSATSTTAGQGAFGFYLSSSKGCTLSECISTSHQGALQSYGFYLSGCSGNTLIANKALQNTVTSGSATALAAGFYSSNGFGNRFQECESNGQNAGNIASTAGYGAMGFYSTTEQQSSFYKCKALGNGSTTGHSATAAGFYFDGTLNPACKYLEIRECAANGNCTSATTGITAYGFWDTAVATTNIFLDCFAASNSDNATLRVVTNYWANLPIGGSTSANFPKVEATLDGLLDLANKPPFYNVSVTS